MLRFVSTIHCLLISDSWTEYFDHWKLRLSAKKTVATCFHLDNKQAARKLNMTLTGDVLVHDFAPKYLGVTLDRSLQHHQQADRN